MLGSARLEVRRVSGRIRKNQVFWDEGDDSDDEGFFNFDLDGITVKDDEAQGKPSYITFDFKFREDPKITRMNQRIAEESKDTKIGVRVTRMSSKGAMLAPPAINREEGTFFHVKVQPGFKRDPGVPSVTPGPSLRPITHTAGPSVPPILPVNPKIIKATQPMLATPAISREKGTFFSCKCSPGFKRDPGIPSVTPGPSLRPITHTAGSLVPPIPPVNPKIIKATQPMLAPPAINRETGTFFHVKVHQALNEIQAFRALPPGLH